MRSRVYAMLLLGSIGCLSERQVGHNGESTDLADAGAVDGTEETPGYTLLAQGPPWAYDVEIDPDTLYWLTCDQEANQSAIWRMAKTGGTFTELWSIDRRIYKIAQDDSYIYASVYGLGQLIPGTGSIVRVPKGGGPEEVLATDLWNPWGIAVDDAFVYFTDQVGDQPGDGQAISRVAKAGGPVDRLLAGLQNPWDLAVDEEYLYYTEMNAGRLMRVTKAGGLPEQLADGWIGTVSIVLDADTVFFTACPTGECPTSELLALPKAGGPATLLETVPGLAGEGALAVGGAQVFLAGPGSGAVFGVEKTGGAYDVLVDERPGPMSVASEPDASVVYWVDFYSGDVGRVDLSTGP